MRRWDALVDGYLEQCRARGLAEGTIALLMHTLDDWGAWLKCRRPRPVLERIEAQLHVDYLASRSSFRAKSTVYRESCGSLLAPRLPALRGIDAVKAYPDWTTAQLHIDGVAVHDLRDGAD